MSLDKNKMLEIFGTEELVKLFNELEEELQDEIINKTFRKSAKLIVQEGIKNVDEIGLKNNPKHKYKLNKSLGSTLFKSEKRILIGSKKKQGGSFAKIFNDGTKERSFITKTGKKQNTGSIKKSGWFDNTIQNTEQPVEEMIKNDLVTRLNKLIKKRNKIKI